MVYKGDHAEYFGMLGRMIRAAGRRMAISDPDDLAELVKLRDELDRVVAEAVRAQHDDQGRSWAEIGEGLGMTRQGAFQRWGRK